MRRLGALDRARLDRMKREADRLAARPRAVEEPSRALVQEAGAALEGALADPTRDDGAKVVRLLAALRPELRAELDLAHGAEYRTRCGFTLPGEE